MGFGSTWRLARKQMATAAAQAQCWALARAARRADEPSMAPVSRPAVVRTDKFPYLGMREMEDGGGVRHGEGGASMGEAGEGGIGKEGIGPGGKDDRERKSR
jgi:hypothetical protein